MSKKTWKRYLIPDAMRGHRPRLSSNMPTVQYSICLPKDLYDYCKKMKASHIRNLIKKDAKNELHV